VPGPVDPQASWSTYVGLLFGVIGGGMPPPEQAALEGIAAAAGPDSFAARIARAVRPTMGDWMRLLAEQAELRARWAAAFEEVDVVLCPVALGAAFAHQVDDGHGLLPQLARALAVNGRAEPYLHNLQWPGLATVAHLPATVRPLHVGGAGLPMGVQVIGPYLQDRRTVRFAQLCDQAFGRPPMPALD
jgi:amidase